VQTDAAISPGSSGGGLFNHSGELVGITTFKWRGEGLNFALPVEWIEELRVQGRSHLMDARRRIECPKNPNYECVIDLALQEANSIDKSFSRAAGFREIGKAQAEAGDLSAAKQSFAAAIKAASGIGGTLRSVRDNILSGISTAQAEAGDIAGGLQTAYGIHDVLLRVQALRSIAKMQAKVRYEEAAKQTFAAAIDAAGSHAYTLSNIAIEQAEAGDIAGGLQTARDIHDVEQRISALYYIAKGQAEAGDLRAARRIADSANALEKAHDIASSSWGRDSYLEEVATVQAEAGNIAAALSTVRNHDDGFLDSYFQNKMLRQLVTEHAKTTDDIALITQAAHTIEDARFRATVLGDIAEKQAALGGRQGSRQTFTTALKAAHDINDAWDRSWALKDIAVTQAKAGDIAGALELAQPIDIPMRKYKGTHEKSGKTFTIELPTDITQEQVKAIGGQWDPSSPDSWKALQIAAAQAALCPGWFRVHCAEALREIATVQAKTGDGAGAMQTFGAAFQAARGIGDATSQVESLCEIATAQMEAGHGHQADQTFASALKAARAHVTDEPDNSLTKMDVDKPITDFVIAQVEKGDTAAAVRNAHLVEDSGVGLVLGFGSGGLFSKIAVAQAEKGDFKHAMTTALHSQSAFNRASALAKIARRLAAVKLNAGGG
jgi:tetratricopeptide (TPR) repeat protein